MVVWCRRMPAEFSCTPSGSIISFATSSDFRTDRCFSNGQGQARHGMLLYGILFATLWYAIQRKKRVFEKRVDDMAGIRAWQILLATEIGCHVIRYTSDENACR